MRKPIFDPAQQELIAARGQLRTRLVQHRANLRAETRRDSQRASNAIAAELAKRERALREELRLDTLEERVKELERTRRKRHTFAQPQRRSASANRQDPATNISLLTVPPMPNPDDKGRLAWVDRTNDSQLSIQMSVDGRPGYPPPPDGTYSPYYWVNAAWQTDWVTITEPCVFIAAFKANFNRYWCGAWADEEDGDDWGFVGIAYAVDVYFSEDGTSQEWLTGTLTDVVTSSPWYGTNYTPLMELKANAHIPQSPIRDLDLVYNQTPYGSLMFLQPGHQVTMLVNFFLYVQTYGDSSSAYFYAGADGAAAISSVLYFEQP